MKNKGEREQEKADLAKELDEMVSSEMNPGNEIESTPEEKLIAVSDVSRTKKNETNSEPNKQEADLGKNILNEAAIPRINPDNEIESGPKEELIASNIESQPVSYNNLSEVKMGPELSSKENSTLEERNNIHDERASSNVDAESSTVSYQDVNRDMLPSEENKKRIKPPIVVAILLILFLIVAGSAAYFLLKDKNLLKDKSQSSDKKETSQEIIKSSFEAMREAGSYKIDGNTKFATSVKDKKNETSQSYNLDIAFKGEMEGTEINNSKSKYNVNAKFGMKGESGSENLSADFEGMNIGQKVYYKLNDFDLGGVGLMIAPQINPYKGKWYLLDLEEIKKMNESNPNGLNLENYDPNKIMEIISKYEILKVKSDLGDAKIGDVDVYHYKAELDGMAIAYMYLDIAKEMIASSKLSDLDDINKQISDAKKEIEKNRKLINNIFGNIEIEVWVGKSDKYIYKIAIKGDYNGDDIKKVINGLLGGARAKAKDAGIKAEIASLQPSLILYYDEHNSYEGFVSPESLYSVSVKLKSENLKTNKDSYVVWSELNSTTDKWCYDSSGKSGYVLGDITGFECPSSLSDEPKGKEKDLSSEDADVMKDMEANVNFNLDMSFSDFNKPITVEKPEGAIDLLNDKNGLGGLFGGGLNNLNEIDSDNDGLTDNLEEFYGTDKNNPDTDGDTYKDGDEVKKNYDPAVAGDAKLDYNKLYNK